MAERLTPRKKIGDLKRAIAALKDSHKTMLRKDLEPLQKRLALLQARAAQRILN